MPRKNCRNETAAKVTTKVSRRRFTHAAGVGLFLVTALPSFLMSVSAHAANTAQKAPGVKAAENLIDVEEAGPALAALGEALITTQPAVAEKLQALLPGRLGVSSLASVNMADAVEAQAVFLDQQSVAAELSRGDVVFVEGWLITHSEAAVVLLYWLAQQNATGPVEAAR